jgi:hypothetical protein
MQRGRLARRAEMAVANQRSAALRSGVIDKKKDPVVGSTGPFESVQSWDDRSGRLRCSLLGHAFCLRAFLSLNDFKFNIIALLKALVSLRLDGTIVDEHIRAVIPADKAEALCVIEPFHFTFNSRHVPYSGLSLGARSSCGPEDQFFLLLGLPLCLGRDAKHRSFTFSRNPASYTRTLALRLFCPHHKVMST